MRDKGVNMSQQDYEEKFLDQLIDNWNGIGWDDYVLACYREYMDSIDEKQIEKWEIERC